MSEKIATREAYGKALVELGEQNKKVVVLDADLAGATMTKYFKAAHPDRFFDCGIAEANMMNIGAGLSTMGLVPFCSTFAMFGAGRAYEQIRNSIAYPKFNVKICCSHAGMSVGEDGGSVADTLGSADPSYESVEINDYLRRELDKLDETERKVIIARFVSERSQRDVAKEMNVSQMYISRLERRVLERLRAAYNE